MDCTQFRCPNHWEHSLCVRAITACEKFDRVCDRNSGSQWTGPGDLQTLKQTQYQTGIGKAYQRAMALIRQRERIQQVNCTEEDENRSR